MRVIALSLTLLLLATGAMADKRVALVIGNSSYQNATPLANPANDSRAMADKLSQLGFDVMLRENLTGQGFRVALGEFAEKALGADLAVVFYAGHGIEMSGRNYLIPVDARMNSEATAQFETVSLDLVLSTVQQAGKLGMVLLDACRDNPFLGSMERTNGTRSLSRGLAPVSLEGQSGMLISFAAEAGQTADDGAGEHSPYTTALLDVMDEPGLEVGRMFRKVRAKVREDTGGRQVPIERMQLPDESIYLVAAAPPQGGPVTPVPAGPTTPVLPPQVDDPLVVFLDAVRSGQRADLEAFISRYPDHPRAADARKLLLDMADKEFWDRTLADNTADAYRTYLLVFSDGRFADQAKARLAALQPPPNPPVVVTPPVTPAPPQVTTAPRTPGVRTACTALNGTWSVTNIRSNDTLFVRTGPGTSYGKIAELPYNANGITNVSCRSDGWCQFTYGCISGWAFGGKYMRNGLGGQASSGWSGVYSVTDHPLDQKLNVRLGPGTQYDVTAELPATASGVRVYDCQKEDGYRYRWCALSWGQINGWAYGRYLMNARGAKPTP
ncbi:caspase family protein [Mesobacterium sp. TK19101]|uniref:Caspase family protein n=1 Tax=Mesobacterium hydrothermale TaxID=3111907 RepID=A0ABU6HF68_9RHOB|nr:caspase family protein [Mesobacterium sp. TK19101]MEC3859715.1 caspase family protein [Mesobacterium sp. TK19101]